MTKFYRSHIETSISSYRDLTIFLKYFKCALKSFKTAWCHRPIYIMIRWCFKNACHRPIHIMIRWWIIIISIPELFYHHTELPTKNWPPVHPDCLHQWGKGTCCILQDVGLTFRGGKLKDIYTGDPSRVQHSNTKIYIGLPSEVDNWRDKLKLSWMLKFRSWNIYCH